ncbi:MAG TPA: UDP-glucose 4-epimerase GalE [Planctomycetota bacterium]|nr:UDP-glucose 4-epimerase GalE [Planctomycetota bacterium]
MNVLVTGGAGYIGSHTAKALARARHTPVALDNLSFGHRYAVKWGPLEVGDLADADFVRSVLKKHKIDAVIHFAANAFVGESVTDPRKYFRNNVVNTLNLLNAMIDHGVPSIVFSSTCATYGVPVQMPISESHPQAPVNPYGESKLMVEKILKWYGEAYGLRWTALRYFNAAGSDPEGEIGEDHDPETHLIPLILFTLLGKRSHIDIFGTDYPTADGTAVRDYIHVTDLADAHLRALNHVITGKENLALNLGTGRGNSVREVISAVESVTGRKVPVKEGGRRAGDPPALVADARKAAEVLGWKPAYIDIKTIVEHAWRWQSRTNKGQSA